MLYFVSIFFSLVLHKRTLPLFHSFLLALAIFPALFYLFNFSGVKISHNIYLDVLSLILIATFLLYRSVNALKQIFKSDKQLIITLAFLVFFFSYFTFLFYNSFILPGCDPIAVPSYAKLIFNAGKIPKTLSPLSEDPFSYPPGYSIFLSIFYNFNNPLLVLLLFKYLNIIVLSLTPALWAFYFCKVYDFDFLKSYYILISFYFGYFLFDRSLALAPYAGKNAVLYCSFLFPAIFYSFLRENKTILEKITLVIAVLGMILIHYSFLYMFSLLLFSHILVNIKDHRKDLIMYFLLFSGSALLFIPVFLNLKSGNVSLSGGAYSLTNSWMLFKSILFGYKNNHYLFIFNDVGVKWDYKNIFILLFFLIPVLYYAVNKFFIKRGPLFVEKSILKASSTSFLAIFGGVILASGFIPKSGINIDFVRWFSYNYNALLGSVFFVFICYMVAKTKNKLPVRMFCVIYFIIVPFYLFSFGMDFRRVYRIVNSGKISYGEMKNLHMVLDEFSKDGDCNLITDSYMVSDSFAIINYKPLAYYAVLSDCRILNGSWITRPLDESRKIINLPSQKFYESLNNESIYYIGKKDTLNNYLKQLDNISSVGLDLKIKDLEVHKIINKK